MKFGCQFSNLKFRFQPRSLFLISGTCKSSLERTKTAGQRTTKKSFGAKFQNGGAKQLLVFSVTPFKIDQNKKSKPFNRLSPESGNGKKVDYKDSRQDSGHSNFSYGRYAEKRFPQIYRDLYGDAMLVPIYMGTNMAAGNQQFCYKSVNLSLEELKNVTIILYSNTRTVQIAEFPKISHLINQHHSSLARHVNTRHAKA